MRKVGWIPGIILLFVFFAINLYTGLLLSRVRGRFPRVLSYGELAGEIGGPTWRYRMDIFMAFYFVSILGGYLLVLAENVQGLFYQTPMCLLPASLVAMLILVLPTQIRSLTGMAKLSALSAFSIILAVTISLVEVVITGSELAKEEGGITGGGGGGGGGKNGTSEMISLDTHWFASSNFLEAFSGVTGIVFAYSGQSIYLELMAEMEKPQDFAKALYRSGPFMLVTYLIVSCVGYGYLGDSTPGNILQTLPNGWAKTVANRWVCFVIKG